MTVNTEQIKSEQEELLDWSLLGEHSYQIERRMGLVKKIELETHRYFQARFDKSRGAFVNGSGDCIISINFVENARKALSEVEQNLGNPDQIESFITKYLKAIKNPKREREKTYVCLRIRKCILEEKNALNKLGEGLELISIIRKEIALYLDGIDYRARSIWMEWGDSEQILSTTGSPSPDTISERSRFISWS